MSFKFWVKHKMSKSAFEFLRKQPTTKSSNRFGCVLLSVVNPLRPWTFTWSNESERLMKEAGGCAGEQPSSLHSECWRVRSRSHRVCPAHLDSCTNLAHGSLTFTHVQTSLLWQFVRYLRQVFSCPTPPVPYILPATAVNQPGSLTCESAVRLDRVAMRESF